MKAIIKNRNIVYIREGRTLSIGTNNECSYGNADRDSASEVDIMCRNCSSSIGSILHICSRQLIVKCRNCMFIETSKPLSFEVS